MKKSYKKPEVWCVLLEASDIVCTSDPNHNYGGIIGGEGAEDGSDTAPVRRNAIWDD